MSYDVIVVGARCAGSPTAMLLARLGHRVLLVDRSHFPSDTVSTHHLHQPATAALSRWGLLDRVAASGTPATYEIEFDVDGIGLVGAPPAPEGVAEAYSVRRRVLDPILIDGAVEAGAEFRDRFTVKGLVFEEGRVVGIEGRGEGGGQVTDRAAVVVGADGLRSIVARSVNAKVHQQIPPVTHVYYTYWSAVPLDRLHLGGLVGMGYAVDPSNDGLTMVALAWSTWAHPGVRHDVEGNYLAALKEISLGERILGGHREDRFAGMANIPNLMRQPAGGGWALVGDAGYHKDPAPAQGISDAFRDAELVTQAIHTGLTEGAMDERLAEFGRLRDESAKPWFRWTSRAATFRPLEPQMRQLFEAIAERRDLSDRYAGVYAETVRPRDFWSPLLGQPA